MMNAKPHDRIKIQNIKNHPFFTLYKINFKEDIEGRPSSQSNLLSDSMMLEGEDPFDDFMNKKLIGSGQNSARQTEAFSNDNNSPLIRSSDFDDKVKLPEALLPNTSFKKTATRHEDRILAPIPEERPVVYG